MTLTKNNHQKLFVQFAGQGTKYLEELRRTYNEERTTQGFVNKAINVTKEEAACCQSAERGFYLHGLDIEQWLKDEEKTPPFSYLLSSPISYPLIFMTQVANYLALLKNGLTQRELCRQFIGTTGFSTGIIAALLSALNLDDSKWLERALACQAFFVRAGARVQECTCRQEVQINLAANEPSCMARIEGLSLSSLETNLARNNNGVPALAYNLDDERFVISAMPKELEDFRKNLESTFEDFQWTYILSSTAAHSPYHESVLEPLIKDAESLGVAFTATELICPVYDVSDGRDLREGGDITRRALRCFLTDRGSWPKQIRDVLEGQANNVIDCGPATGIAGLTTNLTKEMDITVYRCAVSLGRKLFANYLVDSIT